MERSKNQVYSSVVCRAVEQYFRIRMYQTVTSKAMLLRNEAGYETKQLVTDQSRRANKRK